jgi:RHS repeat-associated protein
LGSTGEVENDYLFAGEQFDGELEQYYLRQRFYDAGVGRFTRRDTYEGRVGEPVTLHKYLYGNANPVNFTDPSGLSALSEFSSTSLSISQQMVAILAGVGIVRAAGIIVTNDRPSPTPFPLPAGGSIPDGPGAFPNNDGILDRILDFGRRMGGFGEGPQPEHKYRETFPNFDIYDLTTYIFSVEIVIPASSKEEARNIALEKLGDIDTSSRTPYEGRLGVAPGYGRVVGFETRHNGVFKRFRWDYDESKGPHINIEVGKGKNKVNYAITFPGGLRDIIREYDRMERQR